MTGIDGAHTNIEIDIQGHLNLKRVLLNHTFRFLNILIFYGNSPGSGENKYFILYLVFRCNRLNSSSRIIKNRKFSFRGFLYLVSLEFITSSKKVLHISDIFLKY